MNIILDCLIEIEEEICRGRSMPDAAMTWLNAKNQQAHRDIRNSQTTYCRTFLNQFATVIRWLEEDRPIDFVHLARLDHRKTMLSRHREHLFLLVESGKRGEPVLKEWKALKCEVERQLEMDIKSHIESLPLKMLLPLLLFLFPAFLVLLFGPITHLFLSTL